MTQIYFSEARHADDVLRLALGAAQLPTDDLGGPDQIFFSLSDDEGPIGFIGLEGKGADRLLRSLVVLPTRRGKGYGRMLVERLEEIADGAVERLHLLTSGTGEFFRRLGYAEADRDAAPAFIAATAQFTSLCGPRATYLVKDVG
ncbi:GNAT family N-acetyltransferase [Novosphingobium resinovorum]|jgi:amino-acid N-acetyltransferase|uniref:GNAT family N-acetyltransferase n=1 Tax=Novosphingobium resinovorum TaxID=158500 RepID=A0A1D8ADY3_9SPHN|nr:GNAT family N-acetyltransferase [Novosphingobium resinovorum]AOR80265.1 GNAT family N-acetyltransferase [Novosphingobium resinovorum]